MKRLPVGMLATALAAGALLVAAGLHRPAGATEPAMRDRDGDRPAETGEPARSPEALYHARHPEGDRAPRNDDRPAETGEPARSPEALYHARHPEADRDRPTGDRPDTADPEGRARDADRPVRVAALESPVDQADANLQAANAWLDFANAPRATRAGAVLDPDEALELLNALTAQLRELDLADPIEKDR